MLWYKERHTLLLECFIISLRCIMMIKGASNIIYKPLMVNTVSFLPTTTLKLHEKCRIWGTPPSAQEMECWAARRHIYRSEVLFLEWFVTSFRCIRMIKEASESINEPLIVRTVPFCWKLIYTFMKIIIFWAPSHQGKWDDVLHK